MAYSFGGKRALMSIMLLLQTTLDFVICAENQSSESLPKDLQNYSREHRGAKHREAIAEACDGLKEHDPCTVLDMEDWEDWDEDGDHHRDHHKGGRGDKDRGGDHERGDREKGDRKHDKDREGNHEREDREKGDRKHGNDHKGRERSGTCVQGEGHLVCKASPDGKDRARGSRGSTTFKIDFTIQNIDFAELTANRLLFKNVKVGITEAVVTRIGGGITSRHITADVFAGSVIGSVRVHVPDHMSHEYVASQLSDSKALASAIEDHVSAIPGIESVAHGKIEVNEDTIEVESQGSKSYESAPVKEESEWIIKVFYACVAVLALAFGLCIVAVVLYLKARNKSSNKSVDHNGSTVALGRPVESVAVEATVVDGYVQTSTKKDLEKQ